MSLAEHSETDRLLDPSASPSPSKDEFNHPLPEPSFLKGLHESTSLNNSPTKPLNFPRFPSKHQQDTKECNSSSDTYISDDSPETKPEKQTLDFSSLERNFDLDTVEHTISKPEHPSGNSTITIPQAKFGQGSDDEFSFATPLTSTTDLNNPSTKYSNNSPSKSIMKKTPKGSPKKNVVFTNTNPEIHHYKANSPDTTTPTETETEKSPKTPTADSSTLQHGWNELASKSPFSDDDGSLPPPPPPHTTNSFQDLLIQKAATFQDDDVDLSTLTNMKLKHTNYSNLSLNEKLDLFLTNDANQQLPRLNGSKSFAELDSHLSQLNDATKYKTDSNIHYLSLSLQNPQLDSIENPLDSLAQTEVQLRSSGSSQSSLVSLRDTNRTLESIQNSVGNRGIQLNDGIKGFSDSLADSIIPLTNDKSKETGERPLKPDQKNARIADLKSDKNSEDEEFHDSFDRSYTNTEKSIMNLLNSASTHDLHEKEVLPEKEVLEPSNRLDPGSPNKPKVETIKQEPEVSRTIVKTEPDVHTFSIPKPSLAPIKQEESEGSLKSDLDQHELETVDTKVQKVHTSESSPVKLVKSVVKSIESRVSSSGSEHIVKKEPYIKSEREITPVYQQTTTEKYPQVKNEPVLNIKQDPADTSVDSQNSTKMSIRFQMDKDWKLEDSHDGDREDNDDTNNDVTISSVLPKDKIDFEKLKSENDSDNSMEEQEVEPTHVVHKQEVENKQVEEADEDILANSSNISPSADITLPPIEPNTYSSFEDITQLNRGSFEESLSAEHDEDFNAVNFISIWHTQDKDKVHPSKRADEFFKVINNDLKVKEIEAEPKNDKFKLPSSLQPKKFKEINVMSRRVVSPDFEDLNVTDFLPEISEDSGFENHFKFLKQGNSIINYSDAVGNRASMTPLSTKNVLNNIDDPRIIEPPQPSSRSGMRTTNLQPQQLTHSQYRTSRIESQYRVSRPTSLQPQASFRTRSISRQKIGPQQPKKSRFKVPSFEIKRSSSILSPRDLYNNDIFEDTIKEPPTIKSSGMKTLPSMDKEDVRRIMSAKKVITQEEYAKVKLIGQTSKKHSVVNLPVQSFDELQQHASICDASIDTAQEDVMPHLASELSKKPEALLSKDQFFNDYDIFGSKDTMFDNNSETTSRVSSVVHKKELSLLQPPQTQAAGIFPDPDPELINSPIPKEDIFKTPPKEQNDDPSKDELSDEMKMKYQYLSSMSPSKKFTVSPSKSPVSPKKPTIKIGSPMGLVRKGTGVVAVAPSSPRKKAPQPEAPKSSLVNNKLRELKFTPKENQEPVLPSEPSVFIEPKVDRKETPNSEEFDFSRESHYPAQTNTPTVEAVSQAVVSQPAINVSTAPMNVSTAPQERGRLFFRVIGLKNLNLPDIANHNGKFSITLDNGVHCIKTSNYSINSNHILVGKEFELVVGESLEFILTLKITYDKPKGGFKEVRERKVVKSNNRFSRLFGSKDVVTMTKVVPYEPKDSWSHKFAQDGSFGRCYVDLDQYEQSITCRAKNFNLTCFNEWETFTTSDGKVESTRPYVIGNLEVKMLFVPKSDDHEILPTSIKSAYESIDDLQDESTQSFEGYLFQDGGDCENWKRRFFKLKGTSLIAHSEFSHKTRAKINLAKVVDVIYVDKENMNKSSINYRNFSDVLLVDNAFKIRFANGEIIDFGAPNKHQKLEWIAIMERIVYRNKFRRQAWVKMMLETQEGQEIQA